MKCPEYLQSTFSNDETLPDLPLPPLEQTLELYLESLRPHLSDEEFTKSQNLVLKFQSSSEAETLQNFLQEKAANNKNWLEKWWLDYAYLYDRRSLVLGTNITGIHSGFEAPKPYLNGGCKPRSRTAAVYSHEFVRFWQQLRKEQIAPMYDGQKNAFCMNQYRFLFNTSRIPGLVKDDIASWFKTESEGDCPNHFIVLIRGRFFKLTPFDDKEIWSSDKLEAYFDFLDNWIENNPSSDDPRIAALTTSDRSTWAKYRQAILEHSDHNVKCLELIESSMFICTLDDAESRNDEEFLTTGLIGEPENRWADKSVSLVSTVDGCALGISDHSPFDGMTIGHLTLFCNEQIFKKYKNNSTESTGNKEKSHKFEELEEIKFQLSSDLKEEILRETETCRQISESKTEDVRISKICFDAFGRNEIKGIKIHPDTFVQICLQIAGYLTHERPIPTYETATTRNFYRGRTETVRSCTLEALNLAKALKDNLLGKNELRDLALKAIKRHDHLMNLGKSGLGCDRHLFGLAIASKELNMELPEFFKDPAYEKSGGNGNFVFSTSLVGYVAFFYGTTAPMLTDGYGIFYAIMKDRIEASIHTFNRSDYVKHEEIGKNMELAFQQLMDLFS